MPLKTNRDHKNHRIIARSCSTLCHFSISKNCGRKFHGYFFPGTLLACLVNCIAPGLLPNYTILNPDDKVENVKMAMDLAETWLGVPKLLAPEDMASTSVRLIVNFCT